MSFNINSDKEFVRGSKPSLIGDQELTIRTGTGSAEKEIIRAQLDQITDLPRVGINRTGERVNEINIVTKGSGYTTEPSVFISGPSTPGGVQALASAFIFNGEVVNIAVNNPGSGYTSAPTVTITGGNGGGASATAVLDTVDYELDINGAIRTSTSIISDTARILNLDIDNFITPDTNFRAPNLKNFMNNTGTAWSANVIVQKDSYRYFGANLYQSINAGQTGPDAPTHLDGIQTNGEVQFKHIGFRAADANSFAYNETGEDGIFPRSITPLLGDRSDKIATTEYVLNLATNDVGGRVYVSAQIGSDLNDGRSAVNPVRTIKKAAQIAWTTPGIKETLIVSGGEYVEDNPISLPPDCSIVGDNLRLVIIRPANPGKHMMKFGDKNYVIGVTYRDQIDSVGDAVATWDYAMVFDDKQRIVIDNEVNGDAGVNFPVGHQIFGPDQFRVKFQENTGLSNLVAGLEVVGVNTGARAKIIDVVYTETTGVDAYLTGSVDVTLTSGSFLEGERFNYLVSGTQGSSIALTITGTQGDNVFRTTTDPSTLIPPGSYIYLDDTDDSSFTQGFYEVKAQNDDNSPTYWDVEVVPILGAPSWTTTTAETININAATIVVNSFDTTTLKSIRAEGEVVSYDDDITTTLPIQRLDFSLQGDPSIATGGWKNAQFGNAEDIGGIVFYTNELVGRSNIHDFKEGQEILIEGIPNPFGVYLNGKQRIYKVLEDADGRCRRFVVAKKVPGTTDPNYDPGTIATVKSYSKTVTLSLLNSPNSFPLSTPLARRFTDACLLIRNNREFIADEVLGFINDEFKTDHYRAYEQSGSSFKVFIGVTPAVHTYVSGGTVTFGGTSYNITNFVYDNAVTGAATITTSSIIPGLAEDSVVKLADITVTCASGTKVYPAYSAPTSGVNTQANGDENCKQDVVHFINALIRDLEYGTNHNIIDGARKFIQNDKISFIEDEIAQNIRAIELTRRMCVLAMRNWRMDDGTTNDPLYVARYSSLNKYIDETIINTTAGDPACADVKSAIDTLAYLWVDVMSNNATATYTDAAYLIARNADLIADQAFLDTQVQFPEIAFTNINERKCPRDTKLVLKYLLRDLVLGGNDGILTAAESYYSDSTLTGVDVGEIPFVRYAYGRAALYAKYASKNWSATGVTGGTGGNHTYVGGSVANAVQSGGDYAHDWRRDTGNHIYVGGTVNHTVTDATYNTTSGDMELTIGNHTLQVNDFIKLSPNSLTFECPAAVGTHIFVSGTPGGITPNVGSAVTAAAGTTYNPTTGVMTIEIGSHSLTTANTVQIANGAVRFTCDADNHGSNHDYPRATDPASGQTLAVLNPTATTIDVQVGIASSNSQSSYPRASGAATGSGADYAYDTPLQITSKSGTTITVNVNGGQGAISVNSAHTFVSATPNGLQSGNFTVTDAFTVTGGGSKSITNASYDPLTGELILTSSNHGLTASNTITIGEGKLAFTCDADNHATTHYYPRTTDPTFGQALAITTPDNNTIVCNVGAVKGANSINVVSGTQNGTQLSPSAVTYTGSTGILTIQNKTITPTNATYDPVSGDMELTIGTHSLAQNTSVRLAPNSLTFECVNGGVTAQRTYPRATGANTTSGADYAYDTDLNIDSVTATTITINVNGGQGTISHNFAHSFISATSGAIILGHGLTNGDNVTIDPNSLTFKCSMDNYATEHTYPRATDFANGNNLAVTVINGSSFSVNVGASPIVNHTVTDATYTPANGQLVLDIGNHTLSIGESIRLAPESLAFTCDKDGNNSTHYYPRPTDPAYNTAVEIDGVTSSTITINVGIAPTTSGVVSRTITNASYDPGTGGLVIQMPDSSVPAGFGQNATSRVAFQIGGIVFSCNYGGGGNDASPKIFDQNAGQSFEVISFSSSAGVTSIGMVVGTPVSNTDVHTFQSGTALLITDYVQLTSDVPKFEDWATPVDDGVGSTCSNVDSSISTSFDLLDSVLEYSVSPSTGTEPGSVARTYGTLYDTNAIITYPDNYIYDQNNVRMAIRADYDDYPIVEASPYTQNSSVISFLGGSGALVDGSKVKQPNCPFPGLELDGTASFPNQGKSMVASAFTIVSFGGTGYKIIEDGYVQLVSVFVIFCADGVLAESGGYASITNSATNFGIYALRGIGFRDAPYSFDIGTISNVSSTPTGRTILTVTGLGREPLEHYVVKVDGFRNTNTDIEFFVDAVSGVTVGPPFSAQLTLDNGTGDGLDLTDTTTGNAVSAGSLIGETINLHRPSIVNSSSHTWEFAGSGTNYLALPENGGTKVEAYEQVSEQYGRVYVSGTDELGDFKVGTFARIENRTGAITFTGTVTISEVEFLKLKGGDVVVTGFDASNTLGGANSSDSKLPTQKAVKDYITNNLGPYINKPFSTNAIPRNLVELTDSGKISIDQIPALRPFEVFTVADSAARLSLEGALAGDICIEQDTSTSFILNNDLDSQFLGFVVDTSLQFTIGDIFTGSITGARLQATEYRQGVVYQINITEGGSGYSSPPTVTISGGTPQAGSVEAKAECVIANGEVVAVDIITFNGYKGGKGYTVAPVVNIAAPAGSGVAATATSLIESRLYGDIVNRIKVADNDFIESSDIPAVDIDVVRVVNTSATNSTNWVSLSSNTFTANQIVSGIIETDRLASGGSANSFTFLRGDQNWALAVQSVKGAERRYFAKLTSQCNSGSSSMVFATLADALVGHEVKNNVSGVQPNTNITGVITAAGNTTISLNNPVVATIAAGTVIEFERGESPMIFESTYTQGNFIDDLIISNGGTGFTNGTYTNLNINGGTGTAAKFNCTVSGGAITELTVTDGGSGYDADFTMTAPPGEIGGGSGLVLFAKVSTVNRQYSNVALDVQRVSDLTISSDLYGTIGVARFKKSQFNIGVSGNGSVDLNVGADSGLDADLLDGQQGEYYTSATNLFTGTVPTDRLSGTYNISVSGSSGNTLRLATGINNPTSNPSPDNFSGGIVSNTINNSANLLSDGGTKNMVMTLRAGGNSFDASYGGVRQLAFTDNDNMWLRGSGTGVTAFGSWAQVWTSLNDGIGSELDADRLDNRQGTWYQNALNINEGILSDNRLPTFLTAKTIKDDITIKAFNGDPKYRIYCSGLILNATPFTPGSNVNLYDANGQGTGTIAIDNIVVNNESDNTNDYTIIIGRLTTGNFIGAETIGSASDRKEFQDFTLEDGNTIQVAKLESDGGTANLRLGRKDGIASSPGVYFNSATAAANYNVGLIATGGNATDASGTLNCLVVNADGFNVNGNVVWNAGNIEFQSANVASTAVKRDASGNFSAGTITANLTGASSLNVLKAGDSMSGSLNITGAGSTLTVSGNANFNSAATVADDFTVDTDTLFVDASGDNVGINVGTTLDANVALDVKGTGTAALRIQGNQGSHHLYLASRNDWFDNSEHAMIWISDGVSGGPFSGEGAHMILNGRAADRDIILRTNSSNKLTVSGQGGLKIENSGTQYAIDADKKVLFREGIFLDTGNDNSGTFVTMFGASNYRSFRISAQTTGNHLFAIQASNSNGNNDWNSTPAIQVKGDVNAIAINTTAHSGTDPSTNTVRNYKLNVQGDVNFNGQLFQNNAEFVTSRWTEASNATDIYRLSKVGINQSDPSYTLDVNGESNFRGKYRVNGDEQILDTYGVIKRNRNSISENITIGGSDNAASYGPIQISSGYTVTISSGGVWNVL